MKHIAVIVWVMGTVAVYANDFKCSHTLENRVAQALAGVVWPITLSTSLLRDMMDKPRYVYRCVDGVFKAVERPS